MSELLILPAHEIDVWTLAATMRESDVQELKAVGKEPLGALKESLALSDPDMTFTAFNKNKEAVAMFGVAPLVKGETTWGAAWLLSSPDLDNYKRSAWLASMKMVNLFHTRYDCIANMVDDRNEVSRNWLSKLGFFEAWKKPDYGINNEPFTFYVRMKFPCVTPH